VRDSLCCYVYSRLILISKLLSEERLLLGGRGGGKSPHGRKRNIEVLLFRSLASFILLFTAETGREEKEGFLEEKERGGGGKKETLVGSFLFILSLLSRGPSGSISWTEERGGGISKGKRRKVDERVSGLTS